MSRNASFVHCQPAWFPDPRTYAGGNGVTWSLSVEMFFYLVLERPAERRLRRIPAGLIHPAAGTR